MNQILFRERPLRWYRELDPRIPVAVILFTYLVLGLTVLGFNRSPTQALITTLTCCAFDVLLTRLFDKKWVYPLSALITSFSLSFLLNYGYDQFLLLLPVFFAIGSKHILRFNNKHALNPAMMGVACSLLFSHSLITAAPAYQWNGIATMSIFVAALGVLFVVPKVSRVHLIVSFLTFFTLETALRAWIMKHHLPFETLFLGTLSSPSFFIFTFFMITDPATSPADPKQQVKVGFLLATIDLALHLYQSYYTFFYAALIVGSSRLFINHIKAMRASGARTYLKTRFIDSGYYLRPLLLGVIGFSGATIYAKVIRPHLTFQNLPWKFERLSSAQTGLNSKNQGTIYERLDPRVQHVAKWVLSVGESMAVGDFDNDGLQDIFATNLLKKGEERNTLYRNVGNFKFEPMPLPLLTHMNEHPEIHGLISNAVFVDYDNDGDQDLYLVVAFGHGILLKNILKETGKATFEDASKETLLDQSISTSLSASFGDFNRDGLLDLIVLNVWPEHLPDYKDPTRLTLFKLPEAQYEGDERMFNFMHDSWHLSNNGGVNWIYYQNEKHEFIRQDSKALGLPESRWSLAVGIADFNHDDWPDIYIANDFGPDDLYYNEHGKKFKNIKGEIFGSIGRDTYKGMNVSVADFDRTGWQDIYVTNVHHAFQAEGSLLWIFNDGEKTNEPVIEEMATKKSVLNEDRFGWGAVATDFDNDGWPDLAVANGMVDDTYDKKFESCPDYWYVNEKVARSPPSIHRYVNKWGDLRGYCIYGKEQNRVYLNQGTGKKPQFVDAAEVLGVTELSNSRAAVSADFDNDGRRDLIFTRPFNEPEVYRNVLKSSEKTPAWIGFKLSSQSKTCNAEAIGSRLRVDYKKMNGESVTLWQESQMVSGFAGQSDKRLHFGLGDNVAKVDLAVRWCNQGEWIRYPELSSNSYHEIKHE